MVAAEGCHGEQTCWFIKVFHGYTETGILGDESAAGCLNK